MLQFSCRYLDNMYKNYKKSGKPVNSLQNSHKDLIFNNMFKLKPDILKVFVRLRKTNSSINNKITAKL
ncbi:MAG: hypothetical protein JWR61_475 [Ferruginibacter sp.]|nr:hypothetical protein [Ferruginibacter sp.]